MRSILVILACVALTSFPDYAAAWSCDMPTDELQKTLDGNWSVVHEDGISYVPGIGISMFPSRAASRIAIEYDDVLQISVAKGLQGEEIALWSAESAATDRFESLIGGYFTYHELLCDGKIGPTFSGSNWVDFSEGLSTLTLAGKRCIETTWLLAGIYLEKAAKGEAKEKAQLSDVHDAMQDCRKEHSVRKRQKGQPNGMTMQIFLTMQTEDIAVGILLFEGRGFSAVTPIRLFRL